MKFSRSLGLVLLGAMLLPGADEHSDKSLAARVEKLEAEEAIRMLLVDYGRSLDARDFAKYASLFARDGSWTGGFGTATGPAAIKAMMDKDIGSTPALRHTRHLSSLLAAYGRSEIYRKMF